MAKEENKKKKWIRYVQILVMFALSGLIAYGGSILHQMEGAQMIRNVVMVLLGTGCAVFSFCQSELRELFVYRNYGRFGRFAAAFLICLGAAALFPYLPMAGWPFLVVFVMLGIFSNMVTGMAAGSVCLLLTISCSGGSYAAFWLYFTSGLAGILVLGAIDEEFKVGLPILISLMALLVCLTANVVLFAKEQLSAAQFLIPGINLVVSYMLLLILLKFFCSTVVLRYREKYLEINDPECPLLVRLKEMAKSEYYHAVHTAYLSDRIAKKLGLDDQAAKACAYYHRIGLLEGENTWENVDKVCREYRFPPHAQQILQEYVDEEEKVQSAETMVVLFSDRVVSSVLQIFEEDPKKEIDYEELIEQIFREQMRVPELWKNQITLAQFSAMKEQFIEEKLYYDFLR